MLRRSPVYPVQVPSSFTSASWRFAGDIRACAPRLANGTIVSFAAGAWLNDAVHHTLFTIPYCWHTKRLCSMTSNSGSTTSNQKKFFELFANLDENPNDPNVAYLIASMHTMMQCYAVQDMKNRAIAKMLAGANLSGTFLEAGCGTGEDAEQIARLVQPHNGEVIAVDISGLMIGLAAQNSKQKNVQYKIDNVYRLSHPDNLFAGVHADRLLVSSTSPKAVMQEVCRVTTPGGRICFTDVDAKSIGMSPYNKTTQIFLDQLLSGFVNKTIGRELPGIFRQCGLENIQVTPEISMIRNLHELEQVFKIKDTLAGVVQSGRLTQVEADTWYASLQVADRMGELLYFVSFITVVGSKPQTP